MAPQMGQRGQKGARNGPTEQRRRPERESEIMTDLSLWVDESEKSGMLAVGGVLVKWASTVGIVQQWRQMKQSFGLKPDDEVKWNLPSGHPTRAALEAHHYTSRDLSTKSVDHIAQMELICLVALMVEQRQIGWWKQVWLKASIRDFYCEGLKYVVQRAAEEVAAVKATGCVVVCDTPELGKKEFHYGSIRRGSRAVEDACKEWYQKGVGVGPGRVHYQGPLEKIGFHPSILIADATYHDMLQLADVVVGLTMDWVATIKSGKHDPRIIQQMKTLCQKLRARHGSPRFWGDGLVIWPWQNELWERLKASLT